MSRFDYLIDKISKAQFYKEPFRHLYLDDFFNAEDFEEITSSQDIAIPQAANDSELLDSLYESNFRIVAFPGCITDSDRYIAWHEGKDRTVEHHSACEGFGLTLRLSSCKSEVAQELQDFLVGESFNNCLAEKFEINLGECNIDHGIQKYLDGYEISPHPDIRSKALTFMANINPHASSETLNHHTHYLKFKDEWAFIQRLWEGNKNVDRAWVPWEWCESVYQQRANNSIVIFSPSDDTLHAVKAKYDHLSAQRTQLYGNFWYREKPGLSKPAWEDFAALKSNYGRDASPAVGFQRVQNYAKSLVPRPVKSKIKLMLNKGNRKAKSAHDVLERKY